jgi:LexA-binding, inner membrane-associated putative hydrolase
MPDLLSHILLVLIPSEIINFNKKSLLLIGAILPDIVTKLFLFGFFVPIPSFIIGGFILFHGIFPLLFLVVFISLFFKKSFTAFYLILIGAFSHIFIDVFNAHHIGGMKLFYPFSNSSFRIDLFWPDQYYLVLLPLLFTYILIKVYKKYYKDFISSFKE